MAAARVDLHGLSVEQAVAKVRATLRALSPRADVHFVSGARCSGRRLPVPQATKSRLNLVPRSTECKGWAAAQAEDCTPRVV